MSEQAKKDTSPFVTPRRIKRHIRIQEVNTPPVALFDVTVEYLSTDLPEWFQGLQQLLKTKPLPAWTSTLEAVRRATSSQLQGILKASINHDQTSST